jgi:hypothetical protein
MNPITFTTPQTAPTPILFWSPTQADFLKGMRQVTLADKSLFDRYFKMYPPMLSEFTFTNFLVWNSLRPYVFCEFQGHLIVAFVECSGEWSFFQPIGPQPSAVLTILTQRYRIHSWVRVEQDAVLGLPPVLRYAFVNDRDNWDYLFSFQDLRMLAGKKFLSKRQHINKCRTANNPTVAPLDASMIEQCIALDKVWIKLKGGDEGDSVPLTTSLQHFSAFPLMGMAVFVQGKMEAFAIGEALNDKTIVLHFLRANTEIYGLSQFTFHEFAKFVPESFEFLNQEQDMGLEGLRIAKEGWHPISYIHKYKMSPLGGVL